MNNFKEVMGEQEIARLENNVKRSKKDVGVDALKVVGSTALTSAGIIGVCLLVPDVIKTYGSKEAITFAAVTLLRFKESGVALSTIGAFAGLFGTIRSGIELHDEVNYLKDKAKELKLKRMEYKED